MSEIRSAILIGINDYIGTPLSYSIEDVNAISQVLISKCGFKPQNIHLITSPHNGKRIDVYNALKDLMADLDPIQIRDEGLLFYFSGHGVISGGFQVCFHNKNVQMQEIHDKLQILKPKHFNIIVDACHSGLGIEFKGEADIEYYRQWTISKSKGTGYFASCSTDEKSFAFPNLGLSMYTHFFVEAINKPELYIDGELSLSTIHDYAAKKTSVGNSHNQVPFKQVEQEGYYPFSFLSDSNPLAISSCQLEINAETEVDGILELLNDPRVKMPFDLKRDLQQLLFEVADNGIKHSNATSCSLEIDQDHITLTDNGRTGYNPFEATSVPGKRGIEGIQKIMNRYTNSISFEYKELSESSGNQFVLRFIGKIPPIINPDPCFIKIEGLKFSRTRYFDHIKIPNGCKQLIFDLTQCPIAFSVVNSMLYELVEKTEFSKPFMILKFSRTDMTYIYFLQDLDRLPPETRKRILLIY